MSQSCIHAAEILNTEQEFTEKLRGMLDKILKPKIGKYGKFKSGRRTMKR